MESVLEYLSKSLSAYIYETCEKYIDKIEEIRIRNGKPLSVKTTSGNIIFEHKVIQINVWL